MKTVSIGVFNKEDVFTVVCTLNNNDGLIPPAAFEAIVESTALALAVHLGQRETFVMERQDAPDCVDIE